MLPKCFVRLFVPPVLILIKNRLLSYTSPSKIPLSTIRQIKKSGESLIVIGNGPSLIESLKEYKGYFQKYDCIVVNHFCETDYYETIKPRFYLIADPAFFGDIDNYAEWLKAKINRFIESFISKTQWEMNLIVPNYADGTRFIEMTRKNPHISVFYYNSDGNDKKHHNSLYEMWDSNLLAPPAQTCLNTSVWLGVFLRYKNVFLIGADTSWIELIRVDQETNKLYTIDSHFYGEVKRPLYADIEGKVPQKLHDELNNISSALEKYWKLKEYAEYAGVHIYNASNYSLIDAYERKKIF